MYRMVTGAEVVDEGLRSLAGWTSTAVEPKHVHFRVADVSKPLMSVAEMVDANYSVIFELDDLGADASRSVDRETGETQHFTRRNNAYEIELFAVPFKGSSGMPGNLNALGDAADLESVQDCHDRLHSFRAALVG